MSERLAASRDGREKPKPAHSRDSGHKRCRSIPARRRPLARMDARRQPGLLHSPQRQSGRHSTTRPQRKVSAGRRLPRPNHRHPPPRRKSRPPCSASPSPSRSDRRVSPPRYNLCVLASSGEADTDPLAPVRSLEPNGSLRCISSRASQLSLAIRTYRSTADTLERAAQTLERFLTPSPSTNSKIKTHTHAATPVRPPRPRHDGSHRSVCRPDDLPDHGLHRRGQPPDPGRSRNAGRRRRGRDLSVGRLRQHPDGAAVQLSVGAGARHGPERLLHLHRRQGYGPSLADRAGLRVPVRRRLHVADGCRRTATDHQRAAPLAVRRCRRRHRPLHRLHRTARRRHHRPDSRHRRRARQADRRPDSTGHTWACWSSLRCKPCRCAGPC